MTPPVTRWHLDIAWPHVTHRPPLSIRLPFSLFLSFSHVIILTPVSLTRSLVTETCWRSTYSPPAGNLSHTCPVFLSLWILAWCGWYTFSLIIVLWQVSRGGGVGTVLPRCFLPQVVKDTVNIQIGDVNDNSPVFHGQPYTVHIPEVRLTRRFINVWWCVNLRLWCTSSCRKLENENVSSKDNFNVLWTPKQWCQQKNGPSTVSSQIATIKCFDQQWFASGI